MSEGVLYYLRLKSHYRLYYYIPGIDPDFAQSGFFKSLEKAKAYAAMQTPLRQLNPLTVALRRAESSRYGASLEKDKWVGRINAFLTRHTLPPLRLQAHTLTQYSNPRLPWICAVSKDTDDWWAEHGLSLSQSQVRLLWNYADRNRYEITAVPIHWEAEMTEAMIAVNELVNLSGKTLGSHPPLPQPRHYLAHQYDGFYRQSFVSNEETELAPDERADLLPLPTDADAPPEIISDEEWYERHYRVNPNDTSATSS